MQFALKKAAEGGGVCPDGQVAVKSKRGRKPGKAAKAKLEAAKRKAAKAKAEPKAKARAEAKDQKKVSEVVPKVTGKKRKSEKQDAAEPVAEGGSPVDSEVSLDAKPKVLPAAKAKARASKAKKVPSQSSSPEGAVVNEGKKTLRKRKAEALGEEAAPKENDKKAIASDVSPDGSPDDRDAKVDTRKCFAKRYRPSTEIGALKFDGLRKAFQDVIKPQLTYATKHEDHIN